MKKALSLLGTCATAIALMLAAPASATQMTYSTTEAFALANIDGTTSVSFAGFNTALGTLLGVQLSFVVTETLTNTLTNFGNASGTFGNPKVVQATSTIVATGPLGLTTSNVLTTTGLSGVLAAGTSISSTASITGIQSGVATLLSSVTSLSKYLGTAVSEDVTVTDSGSASGSAASGAGAVLGNFYSGNSYGSVTLTYIYDTTTNVPEPATIALFALGLLALTQWRRRQG